MPEWPLHQVGAGVALVGALWYVALCWRHDKKILAVVALVWGGAAVAIAAGESGGGNIGDYLLWVGGILGVAVVAGTAVNLSLLMMPLVVIVAGVSLWWRERPPAEGDAEEQRGGETPKEIDRGAQPVNVPE